MSATLPTDLHDVHYTFQSAADSTKGGRGDAREAGRVTTLFSQDQLEAIAGALGDTETGLKGTEIAMLIATC
tara:strand:- start:1500 stop:1715 length:216 start_codon:yes stop_codon:yes gene_type:complete